MLPCKRLSDAVTDEAHKQDINNDVLLAERSPSFPAFMAKPLWSLYQRDRQLQEIEQFGEFMLKCHSDWQVWADWLNARVVGGHPQKHIEFAHVLGGTRPAENSKSD